MATTSHSALLHVETLRDGLLVRVGCRDYDEHHARTFAADLQELAREAGAERDRREAELSTAAAEHRDRVSQREALESEAVVTSSDVNSEFCRNEAWPPGGWFKIVKR